MTKHSYRTLDVPVSGGAIRVGVWEPDAATESTPTVLAIHGVTSSHLAWSHMPAQFPGVRIVAPDLRGRGRSNELSGKAGMSRHASDMVAVLDALGVEAVPVMGHSMGAFVAVVLAHQHPERVTRLALIDGGMPLAVPSGLDADTLVAMVLGPTAERLSRRYADVEDYIEDFWRHHSAFAGAWSGQLEEYIAYDLVPDGDMLRPATSYQTTVEDTVDMNTGAALPEALAALRHPTLFLTVPLGLQNEPPGLYPADHLVDVLAALPQVRHMRLDDLNHYTVVMSARGAKIVGAIVREDFSRDGGLRESPRAMDAGSTTTKERR